ncbi:MAG: hypothetical protein ACJ0DH_10035 [bacterium]
MAKRCSKKSFFGRPSKSDFGYTILQNLSLSLGYNTFTIPLAMMDWINPLLAAAAMAGSSVTVVLNSLR